MSLEDCRATAGRNKADVGGWVIGASGPGRAVRFEAPVEDEGLAGLVWVEVRALTYAEAMERESVGVHETYELNDAGRVVQVTRRYDYWAMAEYDLLCALTDFCLPQQGENGEVRLRRLAEFGADDVLGFLAAMPPTLAQWVQECIDKVNLRHPAGREGLEEAKKRLGSWCEAEPGSPPEYGTY